MAAAEKLAGLFGPGPLVVGPTVRDLRAAHPSARAALAGLRVAPAWPDAPRPVSSDELLPERALDGDADAVAGAGGARPTSRCCAGGAARLDTLTAYLERGPRSRRPPTCSSCTPTRSLRLKPGHRAHPVHPVRGPAASRSGRDRPRPPPRAGVGAGARSRRKFKPVVPNGRWLYLRRDVSLHQAADDSPGSPAGGRRFTRWRTMKSRQSAMASGLVSACRPVNPMGCCPRYQRAEQGELAVPRRRARRPTRGWDISRTAMLRASLATRSAAERPAAPCTCSRPRVARGAGRSRSRGPPRAEGRPRP